MQGVWLLSYVILWCFVVALALAFVAVNRHIRSFLQQVNTRGSAGGSESGPPIGTALWEPSALPSSLTAVSGGLSPTDMYLLAFVSPSCAACRESVPQLGSVAELPGVHTFVLTAGEILETDPYVQALREFHIPYVTAQPLFERARIMQIPTFVLVDANGVVQDRSTGSDVKRIKQMVGKVRAA